MLVKSTPKTSNKFMIFRRDPYTRRLDQAGGAKTADELYQHIDSIRNTFTIEDEYRYYELVPVSVVTELIIKRKED